MTLTLNPRQAELVLGALLLAPVQGSISHREAIRADLDLIDHILVQLEEGLSTLGTPQTPH